MIKIGYPCINNSLKCKPSRTFRLKNYSEERLLQTAKENLECLQEILEYNLKHGFFFFRITSDLIPLASHPICTAPWQKILQQDFEKIGKFIKKHVMRVSMHPGQYTLLNSPRKEVVENAYRDLEYHTQVLDLLNTEPDAKMQIHVGGVYGNKKKSMERFIQNYKKMPEDIKKRLVIENDDRSYSLQDCLELHRQAGIPIIFDTLHHETKNNGESMAEAIKLAATTWKKRDEVPIIHYSSQHPDKKPGSHATSIDVEHFKTFLKALGGMACDVMLELKDKEKSGLKALKVIRENHG